MRTAVTLVLSLAASISISALFAGDNPIDKERKIYQGAWKVVKLESDGKESAEENIRKLTFINKADGTWIVESEGKEISSGGSDIDPTKKIKTIDFMPTLGFGSGKEYVGIYELDKDTRQICFAEKDKGRPDEFAAPAGSGRILIKFERVKQ